MERITNGQLQFEIFKHIGLGYTHYEIHDTAKYDLTPKPESHVATAHDLDSALTVYKALNSYELSLESALVTRRLAGNALKGKVDVTALQTQEMYDASQRAMVQYDDALQNVFDIKREVKVTR